MKKILVIQWNNLTHDIEKELKKRGHEVVGLNRIKKTDIKKFDIIVIWNESEKTGARDYVKYARNKGIKTILLQHGRWASSRMYPPFNEKFVSDKICVWGEGDKRRFLETGAPEEKLVVTGTPIFKHLKPKEEHIGINVVFSPEHWDIDVAENQIIASVLRKLKGVRITTKLLRGEHYEDCYDNPVASSRLHEGHLEVVADVLKTADIVVSAYEGTFELMAQILDIPVVVADIWVPKACGGDERYKNYVRLFSDACKRVKDLTKLNDVIRHQLKHPQELKEQRRRTAIEEGGINLDNSLERIIKVIENDRL